MTDSLSRLECAICGQSIYFTFPDETELTGTSDEMIEVTCPKGHSDRFTASELKRLDVSERVEQRQLAAAAAF